MKSVKENIAKETLLVFLFVIFHLNILQTSANEIPSVSEIGQCGEIFFKENYQGNSVHLKDSEQIPDLRAIEAIQPSQNSQDNVNLPENTTTVGERGKPTVSFKIHPGCSVTTADRTYLKGKQYEFDKDVDFLSAVTTTKYNPRSIYCRCSKVCQCDEAILRHRECARAYLEKGCDNCDAYFTSLNQGDKKDFPTKWGDKVVNLMIRKGCEVILTGSDTNDNTPFETTLSAPVASNSNKVEQWSSTSKITSYKCSCDYTPRRGSTPKNPNDPKLVTIPNSKREIVRLLNQESFRNHPGVIASLQSLKNGRSPKNAYILLLGLTGSGKSSAINLLFDHPNITKVGERKSTTTDIHEYRIKVRSEELHIRNAELRVIDTPGIADTRGIAQDARYLATLEDFLSNHEDLNNRLPNIVLIFSKFNDNRYQGDGSSFVKMLRTIDLFKDRLIDKKYTNVIFVMTHYMSESKDIVRDPSNRLARMKTVIEEFSAIPRPIHIVVAENKPEEAQLPSLNGFYKLPNGDFYPKNLFDQIQQTLITTGDPIGESLIRTGFKNSDNFRIVGKDYKIVGDENPQVTKYLGILGSLDMPLDSTQISRVLSEAYQKLSPELKTQYPGILSQVQRLLFQRNIQEISELPKTTISILNLLQDIHLNPASLALLKSAFNFTIPTFQGDLLVGSGYDLVNDQTLPTPIFELSEYSPSDLGFQIPKGIDLTLQNQMENVFFAFADRKSFVKMRLVNLGLDQKSIPLENFVANVKDGYNLVTTDESVNQLSAVIEYHMFQVKLGPGLSVTDDFINIIQNLAPLNSSDLQSVETWGNFFKKYGTHLITSAFGGGCIKIVLETGDTDNNTTTSSEDNFLKVQQYGELNTAMSKVVQHIADNFLGLDTPLNLTENVKYKINLVGGDSKQSIEGDNTEGFDIDIDSWKNSVHFDPIMLPTYLELIPISQLIRQLREEDKAKIIEEAASALLNASLVFVPIVKVQHGGSSRQSTMNGLAGLGGVGDYEMVREFANVFKTMASETAKMQENILAIMKESQAESQRQIELQDEQNALERKMKLEEENSKRDVAIREKEIDAQKEALMMQRIQEMENIRLERERLDRQMHQDRLQRMAEVQSQQYAQMFQLINADNQRKHEEALRIAEAQRARGSTFSQITRGIKDIAGTVGGLVTMFSGFG